MNVFVVSNLLYGFLTLCEIWFLLGIGVSGVRMPLFELLRYKSCGCVPGDLLPSLWHWAWMPWPCFSSPCTLPIPTPHFKPFQSTSLSLLSRKLHLLRRRSNSNLHFLIVCFGTAGSWGLGYKAVRLSLPRLCFQRCQ